MKAKTERPRPSPLASIPSASQAKTPWHRVPFVWLLIALPLAAVVGSFTTLWLAIRSDDGLVEDDYYRRGKEINRVLARDRAAAGLGLTGKVEFDAIRRQLVVRLDAREDMTLPPQVELKLLHATRAGLDRVLILPRHRGATYDMPLPVLAPGRWNLQLAAQDWRLTGMLSVPGEGRATLAPVLPGS
jgi:hypothetical protein